METERCDHYKQLIRSLVLPHSGGITVNQLFRDYESTEGHRFPYHRLGYESQIDYLRDITDTVRLKISNNYLTGNTYTVFAVADDETRHIQKLVNEQKKKKIPDSSKLKVTFNQKWGIPQMTNNLRKIEENASHYMPYSIEHTVNTDNNDNEFPDLKILVPEDYLCHEKREIKPICVRPDFKRIPYKVRENIQLLMENFPDGIQLINFIPLFRKRYDSDINYTDYGYSSITEFLSQISNIKLVKYDKNKYKIMPIESQSIDIPKHVNSIIQKDNSKSQNIRKTKVIINKKIPDYVTRDFKIILKKYPNGIVARRFCDAYFKQFKSPLIPAKWGFGSPLEMFYALNDIFEIVRPENCDDPINVVLHLYDASKSTRNVNPMPKSYHIKDSMKTYIIHILKVCKERGPNGNDGVKLEEIPILYYFESGDKLNVNTLGFKSIGDFFKYIAKEIPIEIREFRNGTFVRLKSLFEVNKWKSIMLKTNQLTHDELFILRQI